MYDDLPCGTAQPERVKADDAEHPDMAFGPAEGA